MSIVGVKTRKKRLKTNFSNLKAEDAEVLEADLDCVEEDDTDDEDYYRDMEFDNWREKEEE